MGGGGASEGNSETADESFPTRLVYFRLCLVPFGKFVQFDAWHIPRSSRSTPRKLCAMCHVVGCCRFGNTPVPKRGAAGAATAGLALRPLARGKQPVGPHIQVRTVANPVLRPVTPAEIKHASID